MDPLPPERTLVEAAAQGDARAVERLMEEHLPGLRAFLRLRMGPTLRARESCSDLAQSVCREVLQHMDRFQYPGENGFKHWLYATAMRKIANRQEYYTAAKRDAARDVPTGDGSSHSSEDSRLSNAYRSIYTPSRELMAREHVEQIEKAFDELPDDYREVIVLTRFVGLSREEAAQQMGKSEASVRNLLHRALSRLAEILERYERPS